MVFYLIADRYNNNQDLYQPTQGPYNESNSSKWVEFKITGLNKINVENSKNNLLEKFNLSIKENVNHSLIANLIKEKSNDQSWFEDKTSEDSLFNALSFQFFRDPYYDYLKISDFYNLKFNNVSIEDTYDNDKKLLKLNGTEIFSPFSIEIKPVSISNYSLQENNVKFDLNVNLVIKLSDGNGLYVSFEYIKNIQINNIILSTENSE